MKKIITLLALVFCLNINAQTYVTIPDANFVTYLQSLIPAAMNGNQMDISNSLVTTTTHSINILSQHISNLSGLQYFTSLTYLNCVLNSLTSLPPLPNSLTYLNCGGNSLTSIPTLPGLLDTLDCGDNSLTTLPALPNSITYLSCIKNNISSLPVLPNNLIYLDCSFNWLTSLPPLPNSLTYLNCFFNGITCFPEFPNSITKIDIVGNQNDCLPNYISAMDSTDLAIPLCAAGNSNGCPISVSGINQITDINNQVSIYPNPTQNIFTIETTYTDKQTLQIFDVNGKLVLSQTIIGKTNIDASNLAEGVYNLSLINQSGGVNKRLVVVK